LSQPPAEIARQDHDCGARPRPGGPVRRRSEQGIVRLALNGRCAAGLDAAVKAVHLGIAKFSHRRFRRPSTPGLNCRERRDTDIWCTAEAFHFAYRTLTGDGTIVARLSTLGKSDDANWALGAIMMRDGGAAIVRHVSMMMTTQGKAKFRRRTTVGGATLSDGASQGTAFSQRWLKLTRVGDVFTAYISSNGTTWATVSPPQTIVLPTTLQVSLLTRQNEGTGTAQGAFMNVTVTEP